MQGLTWAEAGVTEWRFSVVREQRGAPAPAPSPAFPASAASTKPNSNAPTQPEFVSYILWLFLLCLDASCGQRLFLAVNFFGKRLAVSPDRAVLKVLLLPD